MFIVTQWQEAVGVGWMWGMGAFLVAAVDLLMIGVILKGHVVRGWTVRLGKGLAVTEDGAKINLRKEDEEGSF